MPVATATDPAEVAACITCGGIAIYPTETFLAIGCRADMPAPVARIFLAKQRLECKPLPLIAGSIKAAFSQACAPSAAILKDAMILAQYWPGPMTLLLPASRHVSSAVTAGTGKAAVRISPHPAAARLAEKCGFPIISTSANISGRPPVTCTADLDPELLASLDMKLDRILEYGPAPSGAAPSTIIEPLGGKIFRLVRSGGFSVERLFEQGFLEQAVPKACLA